MSSVADKVFNGPNDHLHAGAMRARLLAPAATLIAAIFLAPCPTWAKDQLTLTSREDIIRGLMSEIAVTKVPLPSGKKGIVVDSKGLTDQAQAVSELKYNGAAIAAGMPVQITKVTFKGRRIIFEINGGGKKRSKWYQHLEVGMGGMMQPVAPQPTATAYGSWISLIIPAKVHDLKTEQAKQWLSAALDFNRQMPTVLYSPQLPPKFKEAIKNHQVMVGMDHDAVLSAKGPPDQKIREVKNGEEIEDWIYGAPPHVLDVTFDGDNVVTVRQY